MRIKVCQEESIHSHITGGGYAECDLTVHVDNKLSKEEKQGIVLHEVLENWLPSIHHNKVDELTDLLVLALSQLEEINEATE